MFNYDPTYCAVCHGIGGHSPVRVPSHSGTGQNIACPLDPNQPEKEPQS